MEKEPYRRVSPLQDDNVPTPELVAEVDALHDKLRAAGVTHSIIVDRRPGYTVWGRGDGTDIIDMARRLEKCARPGEDDT